jgi:hypothetical protein
MPIAPAATAVFLEMLAVLYDQEGIQKVIDRLNAMKALLPAKVVPKDEAAN